MNGRTLYHSYEKNLEDFDNKTNTSCSEIKTYKVALQQLLSKFELKSYLFDLMFKFTLKSTRKLVV